MNPDEHNKKRWAPQFKSENSDSFNRSCAILIT